MPEHTREKLPPTPMEKAPDPDLGHGPIPKERYTDAGFAALEQERLWKRVWQVAGREQDLAAPGDWLSYEIVHESILVVRQKDCSLRAFRNVCQHRGNRLCDPGRGANRSFTCRFHGWVYGLDGSLAHVTDEETFPQGVPREELGLPAVACDTWGGFVFVCLEPDPEPLREFLGIIPRHLDPYHLEEAVYLNDLTLEVGCNWKTCVDAFNESYHVQATHPGLMEYSDDVNVQVDVYERHSRFLYPLAVVSPRLSRRGTITEPIREMFLRGSGIDPAGFEGTAADVRPAIARSMREVMAPAMGVDFSELCDDQLVDDYHYTLFPNLTFNIHARGCWVFRHRPHPEDPNRMLFCVWNLLRAPAAEIARPAHERAPAGEYSLAKAFPGGDVLDEDMANLPRIQAGMRSDGFRGLFLSHQELRIRHFHRTLESYLDIGPEEVGPERAGPAEVAP